MKYRRLGKTGYSVSEVSLGTWQVGGKWGQDFDYDLAREILNTAIDNGVTFIDTADVYGDRKSEEIVAKVVQERSEDVRVATKCGRRLSPHVSEGYNRENIRNFVDESLSNTGFEALDLIQLHCPPTDVYYRPEVFAALEELKKEGKILHYGVSVEKVEEALKAIEYPGVATVQIIFNMFRHRPSELFFSEAKKKDVGIIIRVPLASGLLSGKFGKDSQFDRKDHRNFNRNGKAFDKGETFSGVEYDTGLAAVEELKKVFPTGKATLAQYALKWILMFDEISCVIPGASRKQQVLDNIAASELPDLSSDDMDRVRDIYDRYIREQVHNRW